MRFAFTYNKSEREGTLYKETRIKMLNRADDSWSHLNTDDVRFDVDGRSESFLECASSTFSTFAIVTKPKARQIIIDFMYGYIYYVYRYVHVYALHLGGRVYC